MPPTLRFRPRGRVRRCLVAAAGVALISTPTPGCKRSGDGGTESPTHEKRRPGGGDPGRPEMVLPEPYPLPDDPAALVVLQDPGSVVTAANQIAPFPIRLRDSLRWELQRQVDATWAETIAGVVDPHQPWSGIELEVPGDSSDPGGPPGLEGILALPIAAPQRESLLAALAQMPPAGGFGAVELPAQPSRTPADGSARAARRVLAWTPDQGATLVLANHERGLITAAAIRPRYGTHPIVAHVEIDRLHLPVPEGVAIPYQTVHVQGALGDLDATLSLAPGADDPLAALEVQAPAMDHLLASDSLVAGASTKWAGHDKAVKRIIGRIATQVDDAPFLVRGWASDLAAKFNAVLRSWDGRLAIASGDGHLMFAYGSADAERSGVAVTRFLREALDGLSLASSFVGSLPDAALKKRAASFGSVDVHRLTIKNARAYVDAEARALLDDKGNLTLAMAFPPHRSAGMIVIGPDPVPRMGAWLSESKPDPGLNSHVGALRWAISGDQLDGLAKAQDLATFLSLRPDIPPYDVWIERVDDWTIHAHVAGPPAPPPPRSIAR